MKIVTKYVAGESAAKAKFVAKGNGKQKTIPVDTAVSMDANHGNAAGELALKLGLTWHDDVQHEADESGETHTFIF